MRELREVLNEAAYDIECAVRAEWGWPDVHPANQRKYDRDIAIVSALREHAEALAAAPRVQMLDEWRVLYANGNEGFTRFTREEAQRVADEDNKDVPGCDARVVRLALVDENDPEIPESSTRVTDAMRLALGVLTWQMEARSWCGDPDAECPLQDACKPSHDHTLAIAALTAALEGPRDQ
jgi:hypothetical protein